MNKNFEEMLKSLKEDIISEIDANLDWDEKFYFDKAVSIHYIDGEVATDEYAKGVFYDGTGAVGVICSPQEDSPERFWEWINDTSTFCLETESLIRILENLRKERAERRKEKIEKIKEIIGDKYYTFSGDFTFVADDVDKSDGLKSKLLGICMGKGDDNHLHLELNESGCFFVEREIPFTELDRVINYLEENISNKKQLMLTEEQKKAMEKINDAIEEFENADGCLIFDHEDHTLRFANGKELSFCYIHDNYIKNKVEIDLQSLPSSGDVDYGGWCDEALCTCKEE